MCNNIDTEKIFECIFCKVCWKNAKSLSNHKRFCKLNPNRELTSYEKYGITDGFNNKGRTAWNKGLTVETSESLAQASNSLKERYKAGFKAYNPMADPTNVVVRAKHKASMKKAYSNYTRRTPGKFKYGWYNGIWCDSSWELAYLLYCIDNDINIQRNKVGFSYTWNGSVHTYFPDFYLPDIHTYVEVKGYKSKRDESKMMQFTEALLLIDTDAMQPILDYVRGKYGEQFTDLYEQK